MAIDVNQRSLRKELIATAIRQLRVKLGWTQIELAKQLGHKAEPGMVSRWERGTLAPHPVYLEQLKKLARRNGLDQLVQILADPILNWKTALALNLPEVTDFITRLEIVCINGHVHESDDAEFALDLHRLRQVVGDIEARLVAKHNEGEVIHLWTDAQRELWLNTLAQHAQKENQTEERDGKTKTR